MEPLAEINAAPGSANPLVGGGDKAESQGPSSLGEGTRQHQPLADYVAVQTVCNQALRWARKVEKVGDRAWDRMIDWLEWNTHTPMSTEHLDGSPSGEGDGA